MTKCSICGADMEVSRNPYTGKPFDLQMCSNDCLREGWRIVTASIRTNKPPVLAKVEVQKEKIRLTSEEKAEIIRLYQDGIKKKDIATTLNIDINKVNYIVMRWRAGKI